MSHSPTPLPSAEKLRLESLGVLPVLLPTVGIIGQSIAILVPTTASSRGSKTSGKKPSTKQGAKASSAASKATSAAKSKEKTKQPAKHSAKANAKN
jgi:hypothetical protein